MANKEQVIKRLEREIARTDLTDLEWLDCVEVGLLRDALALLKAQEAVEPTKDENSTFWYWCCGECGVPITEGDKFCRMCGRAVKWK